MMIDLESVKLDITKSHEVKLLEYDAQLTTCRFSPCGKFVCAGAFDGSVQRWDLESGTRVAFTGHHGWLSDLAFHPDGKRLFTVDTWGKLNAWNYADEAPQPLWSVEQAHPVWIRDVEVSYDGSMLATGGNDGVVRLWAAADGKSVGELPGHARHVHSLAFHPDGRHLASGDLGGRVIAWDLAERKIIRELDAAVLHNVLGEFSGTYVGGGVRGMAFSPDGGKLVCSGIAGLGASVVKGCPTVLQFDWASGTLEATLRPQNHATVFAVHGIFVEDVRFHREGFLAGCGGNGERAGAIWFWKLGQEETLFEINDTSGSRSLDLHPDGMRMAVSQFKENGRGINGGNGRHADDKDYHDHDGVIRIFELAAKPASLDDVLNKKPS